MLDKPNESLREKVERLIALVPSGRVTTYGDLAALAGHPHASRVVGGIAHYGNPELPWHRLVNRAGGLAAGYYGGRSLQAEHLKAEGIRCENGKVVEFEELRWKPLSR